MLRVLSDNDPSPTSAAFVRRNGVLTKLRKPDGTGGAMPRLQAELDTGRQPRLTATQHAVMSAWAQGDFVSDWVAAQPLGPPPAPFDQLALADQPAALDRAALEACVGASFYPGIEAPRIVRDDGTLFESPFRIRRARPPGSGTIGMALPWQTDFIACGTSWWPAQRPNFVTRGGTPNAAWATDKAGTELTNRGMIDHWFQLGLVLPSPGNPALLVEQERDF